MAVYTVTLGFAPARILSRSLAAYAETRNPLMPYKHYLLDQHYPLNKEQNRDDVRAVCDAHGVEVLDAGRNLGLHDGFNWALRQIAPKHGDIIIAYDSDVTPLGNGWDMALVRAIDGSGGDIVWSSILHPIAREECIERGYDTRLIDGYLDVWMPKLPIQNSICAWSYEWLERVGFLEEPCKFYGHLEAAMWTKLQDKRWGFLSQWSESYHLRDHQDREYAAYKWVHAHKQTWKGDFESWLAAGMPDP